MQRSLTPKRVVEIVERATQSIAASGVEARLLLCTLRHFSAEQSMQTARLVDGASSGLVAGLDLAGDEAGYPLDPHEPAFRWAAARGIRLTAHAGEACGADHVRETLTRLRPSRIGHGIRSIEDPATVAHLQREGVHLEVCPTSNVQVGVVHGYADHPIDALRRAGLSLSVDTDGRAISDVSLPQEYDRLRGAFGWTDAEFDACNRAALGAAFIDAATHTRLLAILCQRTNRRSATGVRPPLCEHRAGDPGHLAPRAKPHAPIREERSRT